MILAGRGLGSLCFSGPSGGPQPAPKPWAYLPLRAGRHAGRLREVLRRPPPHPQPTPICQNFRPPCCGLGSKGHYGSLLGWNGRGSGMKIIA